MIKEIDLPAGKTFLPIRSRRYRPCRRTFNVAVLPNGDLRACDCRVGKKGKHDELVIGNINKNSLNELWSDPRVKEIRRGFKSGQNEVCNNCGAYSPI
jgi:radical SAM protein with 4Fe4S-binding SPASM domain